MKHRTRLALSALTACLAGGCATTPSEQHTSTHPNATPALAAGDSLGRSMFEQEVQLAAARFRAQDLAQANAANPTD